jgi:hypothetical protein
VARKSIVRGFALSVVALSLVRLGWAEGAASVSPGSPWGEFQEQAVSSARLPEVSSCFLASLAENQSRPQPASSTGTFCGSCGQVNSSPLCMGLKVNTSCAAGKACVIYQCCGAIALCYCSTPPEEPQLNCP